VAIAGNRLPATAPQVIYVAPKLPFMTARSWLRIQLVNATHWLNISAGV
jgi:hypothetical protein